jgi:hypothetical protein
MFSRAKCGEANSRVSRRNRGARILATEVHSIIKALFKPQKRMRRDLRQFHASRNEDDLTVVLILGDHLNRPAVNSRVARLSGRYERCTAQTATWMGYHPGNAFILTRERIPPSLA